MEVSRSGTILKEIVNKHHDAIYVVYFQQSRQNPPTPRLERKRINKTVTDPDIPFRGAHEIRLNAKGTVVSFGG